MKLTFFVIVFAFAAAVGVGAQTAAQSATGTQQTAPSGEKPKRQIFRANKEQIREVQSMLKARKLYSGDATGKLDDATRDALRAYQKDSGLKETGTLNRVTLEKMGVVLTDAQKAIPVSTTSSSGDSANGEPASRRYIFRANKEQISAAQRMLKSKGMYGGDTTGKLDDPTRTGLKKYQEASGLKVTGTLNQATLEKMGIDLTEKQKEAAAKK